MMNSLYRSRSHAYFSRMASVLMLGGILWCAGCATSTPSPAPTATPQAYTGPTSSPTATKLVSPSTPTVMPAATAVRPTIPPTPLSPLATDGARLIYKKNVNGQPALVIVSAEGKGAKTLPLPTGATIINLAHTVSPDGKWLAFYTGSAEQKKSDLSLNLMDLSSGQARLLTRLLSADYPQNFRQAADLLDKQGVKLVEGIDQAQILYEAFMNGIDALAWSPDGRYLAFAGQMDGPTSDLYVYDLQSQATRRLSDGLEQILSITWSPDGRWILHGSANLVGEGVDIHYYAAAVEGGVMKTLPSNIGGV